MASEVTVKVERFEPGQIIEITEDETPPTETPLEDDEICELEHLRKLFIGGLAPYTSEESLRDFYGQYGNVVDAVVMRDPASKKSRGFGFVTFTKSKMVDKAQENRPHIIDGKTVDTKRALPRPERESRETNISVKKLFVGGLKDNHDEACLKDYFAQFGQVVSVKILTDKTTGKRRGFAFIEYDDYDSVDKAILQKSHSIKYVVVDVKKSVYNQEKQKHSNNMNANNMNDNKGSVKQVAPPKMMGPRPPPPGQRPPPPQAMQPYRQPPPMHAAPPPNYNYWGPPPPAMPPTQYGGGMYQQSPPQQMHNWGYPHAQNGWNAGPPPPPAGGPPNWYPPPNQWGCPPAPVPQTPAAPPAQPPAANWNTAPVPPPNNPPPNAPPPPQKQPPKNFGTGYQQNYGGGPTKHNMNANRMNPYNAPSNNNYISNGQPPPPPYGGYNPIKPPGTAPLMNNGSGPAPLPPNGAAPPNGNKYRR